MRLNLAERLRCPNEHVPTPLVVVAREKRDHEIVGGFAGCPVCHLEARFEAGHVRFAESRSDIMAQESSIVGPWWEAERDRTIALLGLADPGGAVLLTGRYAALGEALSVTADVAVVVMSRVVLPVASDRIAALTGDLSVVPFTDGTFRAAAVDAWSPAGFVADAVRTVAVGGRVLVPVSTWLPAGLRELARDDQEWVAARESTGAIVELKRRV